MAVGWFGDAAPGWREQLHQSQHVLTDGHRDASSSGLHRHHYLTPQCGGPSSSPAFAMCLFTGCEEPKVAWEKHRYQNSQTNGCAHLHRLPLHGAHLLLTLFLLPLRFHSLQSPTVRFCWSSSSPWTPAPTPSSVLFLPISSWTPWVAVKARPSVIVWSAAAQKI